MSQQEEYLARLPLDILNDVVYNMDVITVQQLQEACKGKSRYHAVYSECTSRLSITNYLDTHFGNGEKFMQAMSICGACIVGPRALEFFVPSRISENSSWDISMNYNDGNAFEFIDRMKAIGVVWITPKNEVRDLLVKGSGNITMDRFKYAYLLDYIRKLSDEMGYHLINAVNVTVAVRVRIRVDGDIISVDDAGFSNDSLVRESVWMCTGQVTFKSSTMAVRLSGERARFMAYYPKTFMNNHSSCLQALIGPYFSCHLYGKLTTDMKTYAWPNNVVTPPPIYDEQREEPMSTCVQSVPEWLSILQLGFKYERVPQLSMFGHGRCVADSESIWVEREECYGQGLAEVRRYVELLKQLRLSQGQLGLSTSTVSKIPLSRLQPWQTFEERRYEVSRNDTGVYIPSLWSHVFGQLMS
jgi:hypothetical protein